MRAYVFDAERLPEHEHALLLRPLQEVVELGELRLVATARVRGEHMTDDTEGGGGEAVPLGQEVTVLAERDRVLGVRKDLKQVQLGERVLVCGQARREIAN